MLAPEYEYISLDFETTGLDLHTDEPIQIGIVKFDAQGKIIAGYQSLLRPSKPTKELKSIVGFITGLSAEVLINAPSPQDVYEEISTFFTEKTIIIGHNIAFDLHFLQKFFPGLQWRGHIDTFQRAQTLIHYPSSYAQEILITTLKSKPLFQQIIDTLELGGEEQFHDAYYDARLSLALFWYLVTRITLLLEKYPLLHTLIAQSEGMLKLLFLLKPQSLGDYQIPPLKKIAPSHTQLMRGEYPFILEDYQDKKSYSCAAITLRAVLSSLATHKRCIFAFSHKAKLDIAKNILSDLGIKNLGFAKEEQTLNPEALQRFVQKGHFTDAESLFLIKYFSHLEQGLGVLDLNSKENYEIYTALKDHRTSTNYPLILTTHGGLFSLVEQGERYRDYTIFFFDSARWYKSFNLYLSRPYDLNYTLNYLDMLEYKYRLQQEYGLFSSEHLSDLIGFKKFFTLFLGILGQETKKFFTNTDATQLSLSPIIGDVAFFQTNKLLKRVSTYRAILQEFLTDQEFRTLWAQIEHMIKIFGGMIKVEKKMYDRSGFYFVYAEEVQFSNWTEFVQFFEQHKTFFLSNYDVNYPLLITPDQVQSSSKQDLLLQEKDKKLKRDGVFHLSKIPSVVKAIHSFDRTSLPNGIVFILSVKKEESKALFETLIMEGYDQDFELLVENITGGAGKNLFKAKQQGAKIIIGGYHFLLQLFAQKVAISWLIVYNSKGKDENLIFNDILWYGSEYLN